MIATDLSDRRMLVLPHDLDELIDEPDDFSIARAVRMSMSIPGFFEPARLKDKRGKEHVIVDGGVLSNYPVWLLDDGTPDPPWPTFGFKLVSRADDVPGATQRSILRTRFNTSSRSGTRCSVRWTATTCRPRLATLSGQFSYRPRLR